MEPSPSLPPGGIPGWHRPPSRWGRVSGCLGVAWGCLLFGRAARGSDIVTLRVWADPTYTAQKEAKNGRSETYVVAEGKYFDGAYRDPSVSKASFPEILHFIAPTLIKQHYYPAKELQGAEELLVVHWGTTYPDMNESLRTEHNLPKGQTFKTDHTDDGQRERSEQQYDATLAADAAYQIAHSMVTSSAEGLLGYTLPLIRERQKFFPSEIERSLSSSLRDDRYFVILQAYDFQKLIKGEGRKLLWSVHMSMRAPGQDFKSALPRMGQVASDLYGQNSDDLVSGKFAPHRQSAVEIGPLTVLSESSEPDPKK